MADKVNSLEVARHAGVSQSAVSRVFTPGASVSQKTREKVLKSASELGYRPNVLARAIVSGKSRIIGLVVAYLDNFFYPAALEKFSERLRANGYHVLVFTTSLAAGNIDAVMEEILAYQVDGILMASVDMSSDISTRCRNAGVPIVLFNRTQDSEDITSVTSDNYTGGRTAAEFLLAGGHTRIGYISGWEEASTQRDREAGFTAALQAAGQSIFAREVGNFHAETAKEAARHMFSMPAEARPDAVFVANDHMALVVMDVLRFELNLRIPEDVSVIGYDDVPPSAWKSYELTTLRQQSDLMVDKAVTALVNLIDKQDSPPQRIRIESPLVVRKSARIPDGWGTEA